MPDMNPRSAFQAALWAGLASPLALATPVTFSPYLNSCSVAQIFGQVGATLSLAAEQVMHEKVHARTTAQTVQPATV